MAASTHRKRYNKVLVIIILALTATIVTGCSAKPNFINGKYYMAGDSNCRKYRVLTSSRIMCKDSNGKDMGYRDAMTNQQLQMYMHKESMDQQEQARQAQQVQNNRRVNCVTVGGFTTCN